MTIFLPKPQNFDFSQILWFLDRGYDDCVHKVDGNYVIKLIKLSDQECVIRVGESHDYLEVTTEGPFRGREEVIDFVKKQRTKNFVA